MAITGRTLTVTGLQLGTAVVQVALTLASAPKAPGTVRATAQLVGQPTRQLSVSSVAKITRKARRR